jgi:predicted aspartyl protease
MEMRGYYEGIEPFVDLPLDGSPKPVKALVDTGFNAKLMLPRRLIEDLELREVGRGF